MYNVTHYCEAETVQEAVDILAQKPDLRIIAGGTDLLIHMRSGKIEETGLLSIRKIRELQKVEICEDGTISIGALVTFSQLALDSIINKKIPVLTEAANSMGGPQIRNVATIGGNICNGATSADSASTLLALNALLKIKSKHGERVVPLADFYLGPGKVDLKPDEMLTHITIAPQDYKQYSGRYIKFSVRKAMDIAILGVSVLCKIKDRKFIEEIRIGLGVAAPTPIRCLEAEKYARGKEISDATLKEIGKLAVGASRARTSWRASKEYREHLVEELVLRAIKDAVTKSGGC